MFDGQSGIVVTEGAARAAVQIRWRGEPVGWLKEIGLETVDVPHSYKMRGEWVPLPGPHTEAFLSTLAALDRVTKPGLIEVTVDDLNSTMGVFLVKGMKVLFRVGSDGHAWLVLHEAQSRGVARGRRHRRMHRMRSPRSATVAHATADC